MLFLVENAADSINAAPGPGLRRKVHRAWLAFRLTLVGDQQAQPHSGGNLASKGSGCNGRWRDDSFWSVGFKGDPIIGVVEPWHYGHNQGADPVKMIVFYAGV
jgi:hypothetical protein